MQLALSFYQKIAKRTAQLRALTIHPGRLINGAIVADAMAIATIAPRTTVTVTAGGTMDMDISTVANAAATAAHPGKQIGIKNEVLTMQEHASILQQTRQFVLSKAAQNDAAHDADHIFRVVALVRTLCQAYPQADAFRAELLAWLHDMTDDKLASNVGQASVSAFLRQIAVPEADIQFVAEGLPYISYRKPPRLSPDIALEIRIVQDADRIDAMGAVGIARTFAYGGAKNRSLADSLTHFDEKLLLLYDLLSTEEGKRIALPRYKFLKAFYDQYRQEIAIKG